MSTLRRMERLVCLRWRFGEFFEQFPRWADGLEECKADGDVETSWARRLPDEL